MCYSFHAIRLRCQPGRRMSGDQRDFPRRHDALRHRINLDHRRRRHFVSLWPRLPAQTSGEQSRRLAAFCVRISNYAEQFESIWLSGGWKRERRERRKSELFKSFSKKTAQGHVLSVARIITNSFFMKKKPPTWARKKKSKPSSRCSRPLGFSPRKSK